MKNFVSKMKNPVLDSSGMVECYIPGGRPPQEDAVAAGEGRAGLSYAAPRQDDPPCRPAGLHHRARLVQRQEQRGRRGVGPTR